MGLNGAAIHMVEHEAFRSMRRSLHHLARPARDEKQHNMWPLQSGGQTKHAAMDFGDAGDSFGGELLGVAARQESGDQLLSGDHIRQRDAARARGNGNAVATQSSRRLGYRNTRTADGPSTAERQVHPQT